jgi:hypothetical protein
MGGGGGGGGGIIGFIIPDDFLLNGFPHRFPVSTLKSHYGERGGETELTRSP